LSCLSPKQGQQPPRTPRRPLPANWWPASVP
jgi:tyrosyl-tRNA synthetase